MQALYGPARHEPLADLEWRPAHARDAIAAICRDAEAAFDRDRLWPLHPRDDEPGTPPDGILRGLYLGAAGMLHALGRLADAGLHVPTLDGAGIVDGLHAAALASPDEAGAGASLLIGSSGILLVAHRLAPSAATADALADAIAANVEHPSNELLLGAPGTMHAARVMHARTGEERFAELWRTSARSRSGAPPRVQWCHGAAGVVTSLAGLAHGDERHGALLADGGELVWRAGPVARSAGLCHGTAGNGFAFLALLERTGDERWLARARAFAMHALDQVARLRAAAGRGRYTLFTGDVGAALLAAACLRGDAAFPGLDDL